MKRIVVIGSGGSGKSTFSRQLGEVTGLPVVHLDKLFWHPNWTRTPEAEWQQIVRRECAKPEWIMDGNFGGTRMIRLHAADTVILLDLPRWLCMYRIIKRTVFYRKGVRPDMAEGCHERFDPEFILWVWNYPSEGRQRAMNEINSMEGKTVVVLKSRADVRNYLEQIKRQSS